MSRNLPLPLIAVVLLFAVLWGAFTSPTQASLSVATVTATAAIVVAEPTATIAPTATPVIPLTVELVSEYALDAFPTQGSFSLRFNQRVAPESAAIPVDIIPYPDSSLTWNRDNTLLRFTPLTALEAGATYSVTLNPALQSVSGQTLTERSGWQIQVVTAPQLLERAPSTIELSNRRPTIRLTFDRPMNQDSVMTGLTVEPALPLVLNWLDNNLLIQPAEALDVNESYHFSLSGEASDSVGTPLGQEIEWSYRLPKLLDRIKWPAAAASDPVITLHFNYPVSPTDLELKLQPANTGQLLAQTDPKILRFALDEVLRGNATYSAELQGRLLDENGDGLVLPYISAHQMASQVAAAVPYRGATVHPATEVAVTFVQAMSQEETAAAFTISPETAGSLQWRDNTLVFQPTGGHLLPNTLYTVSINEAARTAEGHAILFNSYEWTFQTGELVQRVSFGDGLHTQVLNAAGRRAVQFSFAYERAPETVQLDLYQLSFEQWLADGGLSGATWRAGWEEQPEPRGDSYVHIEETVLPADLQPGIYRLDLLLGGVTEDRLILFVSHHTLLLNRDEAQMIAWLTAFDGTVVADADILVYDQSGTVVHSGRSDANGLYRFDIAGYNLGSLKVVAQVGNDLTISGLDYNWQSMYTYNDQAAYRFHIFADRPVYHPGETVYFRAIIRQDVDGNPVVLPVGTEVIVRLEDVTRETVETVSLSSSDFGTVYGEFHLPEAAVGNYRLIVTAAGQSSSIGLPVWSLNGPEYQVHVSTDSGLYGESDTVEVTVLVQDSNGQPAVDAAVALNVYQSGNDGPCGMMPSSLGWYPASNSNNGNIRGRTDEYGRFTASMTAELGYAGHNAGPVGSTLWHSPWAVEAVAQIEGVETKGMAVYEVATASETAALEIGSAIKAPGQEFVVQTAVTDLFDAPVGGRAVSVSLLGYNPDGGDFDQVVQTVNGTTGSDGWAAIPFTIHNAGRYVLRLTSWDGAGHLIETNTMVFAYDPAYSGAYGSAGGFTVTADRTSYAPGETARLAIYSTFSGPALLTFSRGAIYRYQVVNLTAPLTLVDSPIVSSDGPNLYASVYAWQPQDAAFNSNDYFSYESQRDGRLFQATTQLNVVDPARLLNVTITPAAGPLTPGAAVEVTVQVTNGRGEPVSAELSLAVGDVAAYQFGQAHKPVIVGAFYSARPNRVNSYHSLQPTRNLTWDGGFGGGCGCGGDGGYTLEFSSPATAATVWLPSVVTDADGRATVTVLLPAGSGWQLQVKALTADTQVGEARVLWLAQP